MGKNVDRSVPTGHVETRQSEKCPRNSSSRRIKDENDLEYEPFCTHPGMNATNWTNTGSHVFMSFSICC